VRSLAVAVVTGALFALGLAISGMTEPARITGFLDVGGAWDPTLAFVMAGAILVHAPALRLVRHRPTPVFGGRFHGPERNTIEPRLVIGAAIFGVGWGLSGYCPGPALVCAAAAAPAALVFAAGLIAGIAGTRALTRRG
jgi:uncharacterized membrane protein YedE/YeeE